MKRKKSLTDIGASKFEYEVSVGKFTISFDFELGWGALETGLWKMRQDKGVYQGLRPAIQKITSLLDELEISLTWATVGAMISEPDEDDFAHLPLQFQTLATQFMKESQVETQDGRDLLDMVLSTKTHQDIGSHSFSHTRFNVADYSETSKLIEMKKSLKALEAFGVNPKSFVYPVNQVASLQVVSQAGIEVARLPAKMPSTRMGKLWERANGKTPSAIRVSGGENFQTESGSMLYYWGLGQDWKLRRELVRHQVRQGLRQASMSEYHLHLWLHPFNLVEIPQLENGLSDVLMAAAKLRDEGKLEICPMSVPTKGRLAA